MKRRLILFVVAVILLRPGLAFTDTTRDEVLKLNDQISAKKDQVKSINDKIQAYQKKIDVLQNTAVSLENQIAILDNRIAKVALDIEAAQTQIEETTLDIQQLDDQVTTANTRVDSDRVILGDLIRKIDREDDRTALETLFLNDNLSELFNRAKFLEDLQGDMLKTVRSVQESKASLEQKRAERETKNTELRTEKDTLKIEQIKLADTRSSKEYLIDQTHNSEYQFRNLVADLHNEETDVTSDLNALEDKARIKLRNNDRFPTGDVVLSWPVSDHTVTTLFHDPDYPFRRVFEHPGIDIRAQQGSPVRAAGPGYVLKVRDGGYGYSYIILLHSDGISTVYGHLSKLSVDQDSYVERGDIIGSSGAMPGTRGAGPYTTGPHLHFEVRSNGIPVNPLEYLVE
jgi:murein DD-endopeptidase MepM/ murein hydrolase activator NlpD